MPSSEYAVKFGSEIATARFPLGVPELLNVTIAFVLSSDTESTSITQSLAGVVPPSAVPKIVSLSPTAYPAPEPTFVKLYACPLR